MAEDLNEINPIMMQYKSEILRRNESMQYANQPSEVKKRVAALMKQQIQIINLDVQFNKRVLEIEKEFETKYQEIFAKRCDIVNGNYEPTEQECNYNDMNVTQSLENLNLNEGSEKSDNPIKGIPNFWLIILKQFSKLIKFVFEDDEDLLQHLIDVRATTKTEPTLSFVLEFHFSPNDYFSNTILTKEYFLNSHNQEIYKCVGCKINWYDEGKNFTQKTVKKKHSDVTKSVTKKSFFNFFVPPKILNENNPDFDYGNDDLEKDFEIGCYLKEVVIPCAVLYFTSESEEFSRSISSSSNESDSDSESEQQINPID